MGHIPRSTERVSVLFANVKAEYLKISTFFFAETFCDDSTAIALSCGFKNAIQLSWKPLKTDIQCGDNENWKLCSVYGKCIYFFILAMTFKVW